MNKRFVPLIIIALSADWASWPQDAQLKFEAASLKPHSDGGPGRRAASGRRGGPGTSDPTTLKIGNQNLISLAVNAFGLPFFQIVAPEWFYSERFDIEAKIEPGSTRDAVRTMMRNLLIERFQMKFHHEQRNIATYTLTIDKGGPKFKLSAPGQSNAPRALPGKIDGDSITMDRLAIMLASQTGRRVTNQTGLDGAYTIHLLWTPDRVQQKSEQDRGGTILEMPQPLGPNLSADEEAPPLAAALHSLGLKLEKAAMAADVVVFDRAEKIPLAN